MKNKNIFKKFLGKVAGVEGKNFQKLIENFSGKNYEFLAKHSFYRQIESSIWEQIDLDKTRWHK